MINSVAIGVVIPIYNVEKYLKECLESIASQTYSNIEVIMVNDGSTDSSIDIALEYVVKDSRFILINKKNGGLSSARNSGIEWFKGVIKIRSQAKKIDNQVDIYDVKLNKYDIDTIYFNRFHSCKNANIEYIIFPDSDDFLRVDYIKHNVKIALEHNADFTHVLVHSFNDESLYFSKAIKGEVEYQKYSGEEFISKKRGNFWCGKNTFVNFNFLLKHNMQFANYIIHEDHDFGLTILMHANVICEITTRIYYYRQRSGSIMNKGGKNTINNVPLFLREYLSLFNNDVNAILRFYKGVSCFYTTILLRNKLANMQEGSRKELFAKSYPILLRNWFIDWLPNDDKSFKLVLNAVYNSQFGDFSLKDTSEGMDNILDCIAKLHCDIVGISKNKIISLEKENAKLKEELKSANEKIAEIFENDLELSLLQAKIDGLNLRNKKIELEINTLKGSK